MDLLYPANTPRPAQINAALLILRIASALAFLYHGSGILFGAFGGPGPQKFSDLMHMPVVVGYLVGLAQVGSGLAILSGVLIRLGAACIIVVMLAAIFLVHLPQSFDRGDVGVSMLQRRIEGGAEFALTQLLIAIALLITGAGAYSLTPRLPTPLRKL
ncbi:MAG: DoxX family protein [Verrucomicrobia bacterium]|nr:DoxX family protein [Verrucomicrobiota bacterium]